MSKRPDTYTAQGAYNAGREAFDRHAPLVTNNPYDQDRQHTDWQAWRNGWLSREREVREGDES